MRILLVGQQTPLGLSLWHRLEQQPYSCVPMEAEQLQGMSIGALEALLRDKNISCVVNVLHLPFMSNASLLELQYARLPQNLAQAAAAANCIMLQISDCQVFSGVQNRPYQENAEPDTQTPYGALRWASERAVLDYCPRHIVLRTGELYSSVGANVLSNLVSRWQRGESAPVSARYQFCPTPVRDAARVITAMLQQLSCGIEPWGIYHYCGTDQVSYHDFARLVKQILESQDEWRYQTPTHDVAEGLPPLAWTLDCNKIRDTFGIKQHAWRAGLSSCIKRVLQVQCPELYREVNGNE